MVCGNPIYNKNQIFCKQCRKDFHKDYLAVFKEIRRDKLYDRKDADNIKRLIEDRRFRQEIEDELGIPKNKLKWIVKYFYPDYKINWICGKKTNDNIKKVKRITKDDIKDEIKKLNDYGISGSDISLITRISYNRLSNFISKFNGDNRKVYPFVYKNIYNEWFYFNYIGTKKVFLIASDEETLMDKIRKHNYEMGRCLE